MNADRLFFTITAARRGEESGFCELRDAARFGKGILSGSLPQEQEDPNVPDQVCASPLSPHLFCCAGSSLRKISAQQQRQKQKKKKGKEEEKEKEKKRRQQQQKQEQEQEPRATTTAAAAP